MSLKKLKFIALREKEWGRGGHHRMIFIINSFISSSFTIYLMISSFNKITTELNSVHLRRNLIIEIITTNLIIFSAINIIVNETLSIEKARFYFVVLSKTFMKTWFFQVIIKQP